MVEIKRVAADSPAEKAGICAGDMLVSINGETINDGLDFYFYEDEIQNLELVRDGVPFSCKLRKGQGESGIEFDSFLIDAQRRCRNNCLFCFIDQNPHGMRDSIYVKDDDERMSFLHGSYITLTNLTEKDIARIIKMHLSPINVSVHTMNPELRCKMMGNRFAGERLKWLDELSEHGIEINAQLVLCEGLNDGEELAYSMSELYKLKSLNSVSAVPVGVTKHRNGLYPLKPYTKSGAAAVIDMMEAFGERCVAERGTRMFYPSDEFYLLAERDIPAEDSYDGYPQLENGVGMLRSLYEDFVYELDAMGREYDTAFNGRSVSIATGKAAFGWISKLAELAEKRFSGLRCTVYEIENNFFGETVTVSGLITGGDLIEQLDGKALGEELLIPCNMLRYEQDLFLDGVSVDGLSERLNVAVTATDGTGYGLLAGILGLEEDEE